METSDDDNDDFEQKVLMDGGKGQLKPAQVPMIRVQWYVQLQGSLFLSLTGVRCYFKK